MPFSPLKIRHKRNSRERHFVKYHGPALTVLGLDYMGQLFVLSILLKKKKVMLFQWSAKILSLDVLKAKAKRIDCGENVILLAQHHLDRLSAGGL